MGCFAAACSDVIRLTLQVATVSFGFGMFWNVVERFGWFWKFVMLFDFPGWFYMSSAHVQCLMARPGSDILCCQESSFAKKERLSFSPGTGCLLRCGQSIL